MILNCDTNIMETKHRMANAILYVGLVSFIFLNTVLSMMEDNNIFEEEFTEEHAIPTCSIMYDHCHNDTITDGRVLQSTNLSPSVMDEIDFFLSRCFCDKECHVYGDCCPDVLFTKKEAILKNDQTNWSMPWEQTKPRWKCQRFMLHDSYVAGENMPMSVSVFMISECPSHWNDKTTENLCERQVAMSLYDYILDVPVVGNVTNITYANVYCAICNDDTDLVPWTLTVHCPWPHTNCNENMTEWKYTPHSYRFKHIKDSAMAHVTFAINIDREKYFETYKARQCKEHMIDHCPPNWTGQKEIQMCSMYALTVTDPKNKQTYKNKYCAICHGIPNYEKLVCLNAVALRMYSTPINDLFRRTSSQPYSIIMDFMGKSKTVGMTGNCRVGKSVECGHGEICDVLLNQCRKFTCGQGFQISAHGQCVDVPRTMDDGEISEKSNLTVLPSQNCPRVYHFLENHFVFMQNNTVYVNGTGKTLNSSEYELFNDTVILVCADTKPDSKQKFSFAQLILSTVCVFISLVCLALHILTHVIVPQLRNLPGKNLLSLSCSLFVAQFLFFVGLDLGEKGSHYLCVTVAFLIHSCFLSSFFWMNVMAVDLCRTFSGKSYCPGSNSSTKTYYKYSAYAWTTPLAIVTISLVNDSTSFLSGYEPRYAQPICWINNRAALLLFFAIPLAILVLKNIVMFLITVAGIHKTAKITKMARKDSSSISNDRKRFILYTKLAIIMGLTWTFGFVASVANVEFLWYLFIVFNALQGAFIFFAFTFKRKILKLLRERFRGKKRIRTSETDSTNRTPMTIMESNITLTRTSTTDVQI